MTFGCSGELVPVRDQRWLFHVGIATLANSPRARIRSASRLAAIALLSFSSVPCATMRSAGLRWRYAGRDCVGARQQQFGHPLG